MLTAKNEIEMNNEENFKLVLSKPIEVDIQKKDFNKKAKYVLWRAPKLVIKAMQMAAYAIFAPIQVVIKKEPYKYVSLEEEHQILQVPKNPYQNYF